MDDVMAVNETSSTAQASANLRGFFRSAVVHGPATPRFEPWQLACLVLFILVPAVAHAAPAASKAQPQAHLDFLLGHGESSPSAQTCGTTSILTLRRAWPRLTAMQQETLWKQLRPGEGQGTPPPSTHLDAERGLGFPCFFDLDQSYESDHLILQWGPEATFTDQEAEAILAPLEQALVSFAEAGYPPPFGLPDYKLRIYLGNSGGSSPDIDFEGGYATTCDTFSHAYIVLSDFDPSPESGDLRNHELFHAIQMATDDPYRVEDFFWEATAVWAEQIAEPDRTYYSWVLSYYTDHTEWPLTLANEIAHEDAFLHQYGMFLLPIYIEEHAPEGLEALRRIWDTTEPSLDERFDSVWEDLAVSTSFAEEFARFTAQASTLNFDHHAAYLPSRIVPRENLGAGESIDLPIGPGDFGSHYYRLSLSDFTGSNTKIRIELDGAPGTILALARSSDGVDVVSSQAFADESGSAQIEAIDLGSLYEEAWLIVTARGNDQASYRLQLSTALEQLEEPGSDLIEGSVEDNSGDGSGCGTCKYGGPDPSSSASLVPGLCMLLGLAMRRRQGQYERRGAVQ